jgi:hypothetical protein
MAITDRLLRVCEIGAADVDAMLCTDFRKSKPQVCNRGAAVPGAWLAVDCLCAFLHGRPSAIDVSFLLYKCCSLTKSKIG